MKKILKVTALLLVAAAMFAGCANSSSSSDDDKGSNGVKDAAKEAALFKESDVTETFTYSTSTKLADGDWTLSFIGVTDRGETAPGYKQEKTETEVAEFTISESGTKATFTKFVESYIETTTSLNGNITGEAKAQAEAAGCTVSGNKAIFRNDIEKTEAELKSMSIDYVNNNIEHASKTNSDKTKIYGEESGTDSKGRPYTIKLYVMKK